MSDRLHSSRHVDGHVGNILKTSLFDESSNVEIGEVKCFGNIRNLTDACLNASDISTGLNQSTQKETADT